MNFVKGIMVGTLITAGTMMMYSEGVDENKKKMMKKGKQLAKRIKMSMQMFYIIEKLYFVLYRFCVNFILSDFFQN